MRILTFTDIHFKEDYSGKDQLKEYFNSFKSVIESLHEEKPIDVAVLGGDIAFQGESGEYNDFNDILETIIPNGIFITGVTGNHDCRWTDLRDFLDEKSLNEIFKIDANNISTNNKSFNNFHSNFIKKFQKLNNGNIEFDFDKKTFCGYIYHADTNVFCFLLNSSFYSFGSGVIKSFFKKQYKGKDFETIMKDSDSFLGDALSQEGKQTYLLNQYPFWDKYFDFVSKNKSCKTIAFAHHPPNWLKWDEQFIENDVNYDTKNLDYLYDISDLLVTGHIHNPVSNLSTLNDKCYHLANGAFLDYHFIDDAISGKSQNPNEYFPNNWFCTLDVEEDEFNVKAYKFTPKLIKLKTNKWSYEWSKKIDKNYQYLEQGEVPIEHYPSESEKEKFVYSRLDIKNTAEIIHILKEKRKIVFENPKNSKLVGGKIKYIENLKLGKENYLIVVNGLTEIYEIFNTVVDYGELLKNAPFLKNLNEDTVLSFYEFFYIDGKGLNELYEPLFTKFISFKHKFFISCPEIAKYKELNLSFDLISVENK